MSHAATAKTSTPALIVYGQTDKGHKHAAWFSADESASAHRAAGLRSLSVLEPIPASLADAVAKIARGRFVVGQISLTKVAPEIYSQILDGAQEAAGGAQAVVKQSDTKAVEPGTTVGAEAGSAVAPVVSDPWQQIKVGDIVVAEYSKEDGWWEARVVAISGDLLQLSWCDGTGPWRELRAKVGVLQRRV